MMQPRAVPFVVLAGGRGSRFGGDKPLAVVGPNGEALIDYTVFDAVRAGFVPVVVVAGSGRVEGIRQHLAGHHDLRALQVIEQGADGATPPREKPWGTAHAVVSAWVALRGSFAIGNADDLYGYEALRVLFDAMTDTEPADGSHLVAYPWRRTVPATGTANRGVCVTDDDGRLRSIREVRDLGPESPLDPSALVSMNLWGLSATLLERLSSDFASFVRDHADDASAELAMPDAIAPMLDDGLTVAVHPVDEPWIGVTYADDLPWVRERIADMIARGVYPIDLSGWR
jgi:NDP-sugar pyrophosphorylase family protein